MNLSGLRNHKALLRPDILFGGVSDLRRLGNDEATWASEKLNENLRTEMLRTIGKVSAPMTRAINIAMSNLDFESLKETELSVVIKSILAEIKSRDGSLADEVSNVDSSLALQPSRKVAEVLHLDLPIRDNPILNKDILKARNFEYAKLTGLDDEAAKKLVDKDIILDEYDEASLSNLVKEGILEDKQKQDLMLVIDLGKLTGENLTFIKSLKTGNLKSISDLVSWNKSDWQNRIESEKIPLPSGETAETYSENIVFNIERTFPSQFLLSRLISENNHQSTFARVNDAIDSLNALLAENDKLVDAKAGKNSFDAINWRRIPAERREKLQHDLQDVAVFANTYRQLGIADIINNKEMDPSQKKSSIASRLQSLNTFYKNNDDMDLRFANFFGEKNSERFNWNGIPPSICRL